MAWTDYLERSEVLEFQFALCNDNNTIISKWFNLPPCRPDTGEPTSAVVNVVVGGVASSSVTGGRDALKQFRCSFIAQPGARVEALDGSPLVLGKKNRLAVRVRRPAGNTQALQVQRVSARGVDRESTQTDLRWEVTYDRAPELFKPNIFTSDSVNGQELLLPVGHYATGETQAWFPGQNEQQFSYYEPDFPGGSGGFPCQTFGAFGTANLPNFDPKVPATSDELGHFWVLDLVAPRGLYRYDDSGNIGPMSVKVIVQFAEADEENNRTGPWTTLTRCEPLRGVAIDTDLSNNAVSVDRSGIVEFTAATSSPYRKTVAFSWDNGLGTPYPIKRRLVCRVVRMQEKSTSDRDGHELVWASLRSVNIHRKVRAEGLTLLAVRMRATDRLQQLAQQRINAITTRSILDPATGIVGPTRTLRAAIYDMVTNKRYGAGLAPTTLALSDLQQIVKMYSPDVELPLGDMKFDGIFDSERGFWEALNIVVRSARARAFMQGSQIRFSHDGERSLPVAVYSPANIVKDSLSIDYVMPSDEMVTAYTVEYLDKTTFKPASLTAWYDKVSGKITFSPATSEVRPARVDLFGVTDRGIAADEAVYLVSTALRRRKVITFSTDLEGHIPSFGDLIGVSHDMPGWGECSGRLLSMSPYGELTLDTPCPTSLALDGLRFYVRPNRGGGTTFIGPYDIIDRSEDGLQITIAEVDGAGLTTLSDLAELTDVSMDRELPLFFIGDASSVIYQKALVTKITPRNESEVEIQALNYDPAVYTDVAERQITYGVSRRYLTNRVPRVVDITATNAGDGSNPLVDITIGYQGEANYFKVEWRAAPAGPWIRGAAGESPKLSFAVPSTSGLIYLRVVAYNGAVASPEYLDQFSLSAKPLAAVTGFTFKVERYGVRLSWNPNTESHLVFYELRIGTSWESAETLAHSKTSTYLWETQKRGRYQLWIKAVGSLSESVVAVKLVVLVEPPQNVAGFNAHRTGDLVNFSWRAVRDIDFAYYEVRRGLSWETATKVGATTSTSLSLYTPRGGVFFVKAFDTSGDESELAPRFFIPDSNTLYNLFTHFEELDGWDGQRTNLVEYRPDSQTEWLNALLWQNCLSWDTFGLLNGVCPPVATVGSAYPRPEAGAEIMFTRFDEEYPLNAVNLVRFTGGARDTSRKKTGIASRYYGSSYSNLTPAFPNGKGAALGTTSWCVEGWICADPNPNANEGVFTTCDLWDGGLEVGSRSRMRLLTNSVGKLIFELECYGTEGPGFGTPALFRIESQAGALLQRDGSFLHFSVRRQSAGDGLSDRLILGINGVRAGSVALYSDADLGSAVPFFVGTSGSAAGGLFKGSVDNFRVWVGDPVYPVMTPMDSDTQQTPLALQEARFRPGILDFTPAAGARELAPAVVGSGAGISPVASGASVPALNGQWALDGTELLGTVSATTQLSGIYQSETIAELPVPRLDGTWNLDGVTKAAIPDVTALLKGAVSVDIQVVALDLDGRFTTPPDGYFSLRYEVRMASRLAPNSFEPEFSEWTEFTFGVYEFRYMQVRVFLSTIDAHYRPLLSSLRVYVDSPRRELHWTGKEISVDGTYITFSPAFIDVPSIQVTPSGVNAKPVVTNKTSSGFLLALAVDSGENVAASADIDVFGFGET